MKEKIVYIDTEIGKLPMAFNLNVMEEIQEEYGSLEKWGDVVEGDGEPKIKDLKCGLLSMINEGIDIENEKETEKKAFITSKQLGRILTKVSLNDIFNKIKEMTKNSTKIDEEEKNV